MELEQAVAQKVIVWFAGQQAPPELLALLREQTIGGVTLFRHLNGGTPSEVRALTNSLQAAARFNNHLPLLICADQEGGQLQAIAGTTAFPGNMALGAAGDSELARRVGAAIGAELAAVGVNVNYAPACDVNINPANPVIGTRSFGEDPALVARLTAAMVEGIQSAGVAAVAKHFPGHGDTAHDSHNTRASVPHDRARLDAVELRPFREAIAAGVRGVMSAHLALPLLTGQADLPATFSPRLLRDLLRTEFHFDGVTISDAMNMAGIGADQPFASLVVRAVAAGIDLLLLAPPNDHAEANAAILAAAHNGTLDPTNLQVSAGRVLALKHWLAEQVQPALDVVGNPAHRALANEVASRAITLVRTEPGRLPLCLEPNERVAVVVPELADLTPADTSSYERCELARAVRRFHTNTDELIIPADPSALQVAELATQLEAYDLVLIGTINAQTRPGQANLVSELVRRDVAVVAVAMRLPYDLVAYPEAHTYLCTYSILPPAMEALASALWGRAALTGRLPTTIPGLFPIGYGIV